MGMLVKDRGATQPVFSQVSRACSGLLYFNNDGIHLTLAYAPYFDPIMKLNADCKLTFLC